jgi:hypothetical protein
MECNYHHFNTVIMDKEGGLKVLNIPLSSNISNSPSNKLSMSEMTRPKIPKTTQTDLEKGARVMPIVAESGC